MSGAHDTAPTFWRWVSWRSDRLVDAGLSPRLADQLASDSRIDVHALLDLVDRGCPPALAARILAPLDPDPPAA